MQIDQFHPVFNRKEIAKDLKEYALQDGFFSEYSKTKELEDKIATFLGVKHCIMVNNGTISLSIALLAQGIKPGDKVIIPNITMFATQAAVELIGAIPVFIDIEKENLCLDLEKAKERIVFGWNSIKAVIYVTLNGRSHGALEYFRFQSFCRKNKIVLIEDNAQSFGSHYTDGYLIGAPYNDGIGSFSFSMPKIITCGQGGCLVTDDDVLAKKIRKLKDFGRSGGGTDIHDSFGINSKFTELQAIVGLSQFKDLRSKIQKKKEIYSSYYNKLIDIKAVTFFNNHKRWCPWFVDVSVSNREQLQKFLKEKGIGTRAIYPELTSQKVNHKLFHPRSMKVSNYFANRVLWLPSSLDITEKEIKYITDSIKEFYETNGNV